MGILDDLKHKVEKLGDKAKEGFDDAKDKAGDLLDDAKDRIGHHDETPLSESSDVGPDTSSTDAVSPGYVAAEDDVTEGSDASSLDAVAQEDLDDPVAEEEVLVAEPVPSSDVVPPAAAELDPVDLDAEETDGTTDPAAGTEVPEPVVETDVDPYEQPLTETIGDEIASAGVDSKAVSEAVDPPTGQDTRA